MPQVPNNVKFGVPLMVASFLVFAIALWAGAQLIDSEGGTEAAPADNGSDGGAGGPVTVTVTAKNTQFDRRTLTANAGATFTVNFQNQDAGVPHNIAFYTTRQYSALVTPDAKTPVDSSNHTLTFTPPRAGSIYYRCDVHPDTMTGTVTVR